VNGQKIFAASFSKGGTVMLNVSEAKFLPGKKERFAAIMPFYPGCNPDISPSGQRQPENSRDHQQGAGDALRRVAFFEQMRAE
jgi:hypothetical protein